MSAHGLLTRRPMAEAALVALSICALASQSGVKLAIVNETASLPRGLYVRVIGAEPRRGAIVALPPPPAAQPYLQQLGMPNGALLLKRVAAGQGDLVCAGQGQVQIPGRELVVRAIDRSGRPLAAWEGCERLGPGEVFLAGDSPASFDSRYFGPARASSLSGVFKLVIPW